ncbi:hypothetical protein KIMH_09270 [Bombiscardovia apis]|uniref:Zinc ABC transporter permease n=1 Tax=Bombiscardovia apis TaxID=2932182 RepID=A0ABM8BD49_9BIFI|nr:DUF3159 domain-containing protein [Bombiscardovia apis]BDR54816.1 hypothetical protein KIMH_09270 [Bombiscardovia apis]
MSKQAKTGIAALGSEDFNVYQAIGGARGIAESLLPGLVFLVMFLATSNLQLTVAVSGGLALLQLLLRLVQRQSWLGALTGILAMAICLLWAWLSRDARNYYLPGFITNVAWILGLCLTLLLRAPGLGLLVEYLREPVLSGLKKWLEQWRRDRALYQAYWRATLLWIGMFAARLLVQLPLYLNHRLAWLGSARLVMGLPLFAFVIWLSWLWIAQPYHDHHRGERSAQSEEDEGAL